MNYFEIFIVKPNRKMYRILYLLGFLFISCGSGVKQHKTVVKPIKKPGEKYNFIYQITRYYPHCGGITPTEEQRNRNSPERGTFILVNLDTKEKSTFTTDSLGRSKFYLKPAHYIIKEKFKDTTFKAFYKQYFQKTNKESAIVSKGKACYKNWWKTALVEFQIQDTTKVLSLQSRVSDACFTGKNPCLSFTGPMPP